MKDGKKPEIGMVFGVFDGLHQGHKYFLSVAAQKSRKLIVVVTLPEIVYALKGRYPKYSYEERVQKINDFNPNILTIEGDNELGKWKVLRDHQPEIVFLGHDQNSMAKELQKLKIPFEFVDLYRK